MVWSTTQSALYNDLSRYYEEDKKAADPQDIEPKKFERIIREKTHENRLEKERKDPCETGCNASDENSCEKRLNICSEAHTEYPNCPCRQNSMQNPLSRLLSDKDMLLIAGLIFLLIKQGADKKLILALAFVLLS